VVVLAGLEKVGFVASYAVAMIAQIPYLISDAPVKTLQPFEEWWYHGSGSLTRM
jgi:hypothetical protein